MYVSLKIYSVIQISLCEIFCATLSVLFGMPTQCVIIQVHVNVGSIWTAYHVVCCIESRGQAEITQSYVNMEDVNVEVFDIKAEPTAEHGSIMDNHQ